MTQLSRGSCLINAFGVLALCISIAQADESLKDIACRSVHLNFPAAEGLAFYNEITIDQSAAGTYFAVCGWDKGYYGLQELANGKKLLIFSVWDSNQDDPSAVAEDNRTKLIYKDEQVRTGRFGGEGTGGQSFFDYDWKVGEMYRLLVTAKINDKRTEYSGYFYVPDDQAWKKLVTFSTVTGGQNLRGYYSFVEDFKRDRLSATKVRQAHFGNGWIKNKEGKLVALTRARFTADSNPVTNINASIDGDRFSLVTGGETKNSGTRLLDSIDLPNKEPGQPPEEFWPAVKATTN